MSSDQTLRRRGFLAAGLLFLHALLSVYWALGGTALLSLISDGIREQADLREAWFVTMVWGVAVLKVLAGVVILAVSLRRIGSSPHWIPLSIVWAVGIVLTLYGLMNLGLGVFAIAGIIEGPAERDRAFWGYLLLWAPWWLAIGIASLATARAASAWRRMPGPEW